MSDESNTLVPNVCNIPVVDDLDSTLIVQLATKTLIGGLSPKLSRWRERQLFLNLVRLSGRVIVELGHARDSLEDYIANRHQGRISPLYSSISHMEAAITALARCLVFTNALKGSPIAPGISNKELPRKSVQDAIRHLRNAIEHTDDALKNGAISSGMAMLHILDDRLELEGYELRWAELELAVRKVHAVTKRLIDLS